MEDPERKSGRRIILSCLAIGFFLASPVVSPEGEPHILRVRIGQSVGDFMAVNNLKKEDAENFGPLTIPVDRLEDWMSISFDRASAIFRYEDGIFGFDLPPGQSMSIGQHGGTITDIFVSADSNDHHFRKIDPTARKLLDNLIRNGWKPIDLHFPKHELDTNSSDGTIYYGTLAASSGNQLSVRLRTYLDPPFFIMHVEIRGPDDLFERRSDVVAARRFALKDNPEKSTLRLWLQDQDWSPEELGMKQVDVINPKWSPNSPTSGRRIFKRWQMPDGTTEPTFR
jgi:hypothetical protein